VGSSKVQLSKCNLTCCHRNAGQYIDIIITDESYKKYGKIKTLEEKNNKSKFLEDEIIKIV
jgi:hypothetical protein